MAQNNEQENSLSIKDLVYACLRRWKWFALSLAICLFIAIVYIVRYQPEYSRSAEVQIKEDNQRRSVSSSIEGMTDFSLFQSKSSVYDEIKAFGARSTMQEVVRRLHLDMDYSTPIRFREKVLYANTLPLTVQLPIGGIQAFDRIGGINDGPDFSRKLENRGDCIPVRHPGFHGIGVLA